MIIVRMPPSPTGRLHLGTARTALFNYLLAKKNNGQIIFRWEDTDQARSKAEYETEILEGLKWLGMDFEKESPKLYRQTESLPEHKKWIDKLWKAKKIFPCFLSTEEIESMRQKAQKEKQNFVLWSPYRDYDAIEAQKKIGKGERFVWRLRVPQNQDIVFEDLIRGKISVNTNTLGDFVIAKDNGHILYILGNVLDDYTQGINHVIRGEDHISNTPKQILIYEAIEAKLPRFGHIPLVLDAKRRKLSKRHVEPGVCVLISDFQAAGFVPEAVVNGLAFLGWNPKNTTEEIFSLSDLENIFELKNINAAAAQYDFDKMKWFNAKWLQKLDLTQLKIYFQEWIATYKPEAKKYVDMENFDRALLLAREKAKTMDELLPEFAYLLDDPGIDVTRLLHKKFVPEKSEAKKTLSDIANLLQNISDQHFQKETLYEKIVEYIQKNDLKNGPVLWPFRVSLSNQEKSAGPFEIAQVLGKTKTLERLQRAIKCL